MTDAMAQYRVIRVVVDGEVNIYLGDHQPPHHAVSRQVEHLLVLSVARHVITRVKRIDHPNATCKEALVVVEGSLLLGGQVLWPQLLYRQLLIVANLVLLELIQNVAHKRIADEKDARK